MATKFIATLGLRLLTILGIIALAKTIKTAVNGNANFPVPPSLSELETATTDAETAVNDVAAKKAALATAVAVQDQKIDILKDIMRGFARYVTGVAAGDRAIIESAGMPASEEASPVYMSRVESLSLTHGDDAGEVDAHWHKVAKSDNYTIETSATAPDAHGIAPWQNFGLSSKSKFTLTGLTSGNPLWIRVRANGKRDTGAWSDPAFIIVP